MDENLLHARSTWWSRGLIVTGIAIAVLNMVLAWIIIFKGPSPQSTSNALNPLPAQSSIEASKAQSDAKPPMRSDATTRAQRSSDSADSSNGLLAKMFEAYQRSVQFEERQITLILGFCFALISIGFSLFVMGIEGTAGFKGSAKEFGALAVKVSSPGIFCILLASILVGMRVLVAPGGSAVQSAESKTDVVRAESEGKERVLRAEAHSKEGIIRAEAQARDGYTRAEAEVKERLIEADTRAKKELLEAEAEAKERLIEADTGAKKELLEAEAEAKERLLMSEPAGRSRK